MITEQTLLEAGFKLGKDHFRDTMFYQKRVWRGDQTLYFINLYMYKHNEHTHWELDMAFDRDSKSFPYTWIKVIVSSKADVEDVFSLAHDVFNSNNGVPYGD